MTPKIKMSAGELRAGFEKMPRPFPAAVLFGLESGLTPDQLVSLTWINTVSGRSAAIKV